MRVAADRAGPEICRGGPARMPGGGRVTPEGTYEQRRRTGAALRRAVPRSSHRTWRPPANRADPVTVLEENNRLRLPDLVPVRYGRMLTSPFAFLRGSAVIMANDLAKTPTTALRVQACGDAHLGNFGVFGTPERNLVFDVNDFDETLPGPWEWDVKRLAVSVVLAARNLRVEERQAATMAGAAVRAYRSRMAELAAMGPLDVWYDHIDVATVLAIAKQGQANDLRRQLRVARVRQRTSLRVLPKLTTEANGTRKIIEDPPLIGHLDPETFDGAAMIASYAKSLPPDRRPLLERYTLLDTAGSGADQSHRVSASDADGSRARVPGGTTVAGPGPSTESAGARRPVHACVLTALPTGRLAGAAAGGDALEPERFGG